jgi:hypothetical protein
MLGIPLDITRQFRAPIAGIRLGTPGNGASLNLMLVPETPVNEDDLISGPEHKVGFAGKILGVKTEAVSHPMR